MLSDILIGSGLIVLAVSQFLLALTVRRMLRRESARKAWVQVDNRHNLGLDRPNRRRRPPHQRLRPDQSGRSRGHQSGMARPLGVAVLPGFLSDPRSPRPHLSFSPQTEQHFQE